jgi:hypothetical protein
MYISAVVRNKEGLIKTDCADGVTRYLTDEEYVVELKRRELKQAERKLKEKKDGN